MAVPDFQTLMLPVLQACRDGDEHRTAALVEAMADRFELTAEEREQLVPSGQQRLIANRTHWAITYLVKAGLLQRIRKGVIRITERGRRVLDEKPERIDTQYLKRFPELRAFLEPAGDEDEEGALAMEGTPDEIMRSAHERHEAALRSELLDRILAAPAAFFERLVVRLLVAMGYGSDLGGRALVVGRSGDGGSDGIVDQDPLGLDRVYV